MPHAFFSMVNIFQRGNEAVDQVGRGILLAVDTLSVKTDIVAALAAHAGHLEAVSLNPMFAPALRFDGRRVAAVVGRDGPRARALLDAVDRRGGRVAELGADEHDRIAAVTQAVVLAFGLALGELGVAVKDLGAVATPPHLTLPALLARLPRLRLRQSQDSGDEGQVADHQGGSKTDGE
jgi:prephenate dehydrogenase